MRAASGGWAGVVPHALSKEKTEEKKENLQKLGTDRRTESRD